MFISPFLPMSKRDFRPGGVYYYQCVELEIQFNFFYVKIGLQLGHDILFHQSLRDCCDSLCYRVGYVSDNRNLDYGLWRWFGGIGWSKIWKEKALFFCTE